MGLLLDDLLRLQFKGEKNDGEKKSNNQIRERRDRLYFPQSRFCYLLYISFIIPYADDTLILISYISNIDMFPLLFASLFYVYCLHRATEFT